MPTHAQFQKFKGVRLDQLMGITAIKTINFIDIP